MAQQEVNFFLSVSLSSARKLASGQAEELLMSLASPPLPLILSLCSWVVGGNCRLSAPKASTHSPKSLWVHTRVYTNKEGKHKHSAHTQTVNLDAHL